jgi:hypothetical protein
MTLKRRAKKRRGASVLGRSRRKEVVLPAVLGNFSQKCSEKGSIDSVTQIILFHILILSGLFARACCSRRNRVVTAGRKSRWRTSRPSAPVSRSSAGRAAPQTIRSRPSNLHHPTLSRASTMPSQATIYPSARTIATTRTMPG